MQELHGGGTVLLCLRTIFLAGGTDSLSGVCKIQPGAVLLIENYGSKVRIFQNSIPISVRAAEISAEGVSIYRHDPKGKVASAYQSLTEEVLRDE